MPFTGTQNQQLTWSQSFSLCGSVQLQLAGEQIKGFAFVGMGVGGDEA